MKGSPVLGQFAVYKTNCSGINSVEELSSNTIIFDLFPNPSNGKITIKLEENINNCILTVYSVLGEVLSHKTISGQSTDLDLNLKTGLYFISINSKGQKATKKIIVE